MWRGRSVGLVRVGWGVALLVRPEMILAPLGAGNDVAFRRASRVLGGRDLAQGVLVAGGDQHRKTVRRWVDVAHAVSMLTLAAFDRPRRRVALLSAGVAAAWALLGAD